MALVLDATPAKTVKETHNKAKVVSSTQRTPEAIAEVFWLAFNALSEEEQEAVLERLQASCQLDLSPQPADSLRKLVGLIAVGGDALLDSERYYDDL